jgi:hypothetical protein
MVVVMPGFIDLRISVCPFSGAGEIAFFQRDTAQKGPLEPDVNIGIAS